MSVVLRVLRRRPFYAFAAACLAVLGFGAPAFAQGATDPLAALVSGISFTNLETDVVAVGVALASLYIVWVGVHWILRMIRHG